MSKLAQIAAAVGKEYLRVELENIISGRISMKGIIPYLANVAEYIIKSVKKVEVVNLPRAVGCDIREVEVVKNAIVKSIIEILLAIPDGQYEPHRPVRCVPRPLVRLRPGLAGRLHHRMHGQPPATHLAGRDAPAQARERRLLRQRPSPL